VADGVCWNSGATLWTDWTSPARDAAILAASTSPRHAAEADALAILRLSDRRQCCVEVVALFVSVELHLVHVGVWERTVRLRLWWRHPLVAIYKPSILSSTRCPANLLATIVVDLVVLMELSITEVALLDANLIRSARRRIVMATAVETILHAKNLTDQAHPLVWMKCNRAVCSNSTTRQFRHCLVDYRPIRSGVRNGSKVLVVDPLRERTFLVLARHIPLVAVTLTGVRLTTLCSATVGELRTLRLRENWRRLHAVLKLLAVPRVTRRVVYAIPARSPRLAPRHPFV
jgi:hypothetical protein